MPTEQYYFDNIMDGWEWYEMEGCYQFSED